MAKKATDSGGTLGDIAESLGTLLGNAEKQWRAWQGPRDSVLKAVTDVRDRASALLAEMGGDVRKGYDKSQKAGKKKDGKKARKAEKAAKAEQIGKADKKARKDQKRGGKKKKGKKAGAAATPADDAFPPEPVE